MAGVTTPGEPKEKALFGLTGLFEQRAQPFLAAADLRLRLPDIADVAEHQDPAGVRTGFTGTNERDLDAQEAAGTGSRDEKGNGNQSRADEVPEHPRRNLEGLRCGRIDGPAEHPETDRERGERDRHVPCLAPGANQRQVTRSAEAKEHADQREPVQSVTDPRKPEQVPGSAT